MSVLGICSMDSWLFYFSRDHGRELITHNPANSKLTVAFLPNVLDRIRRCNDRVPTITRAEG